MATRKRKYNTLILGCGSYESSRVTEVLVAWGGKGVEDPKELTEAFVEFFLNLCRHVLKEEELCNECAEKTSTDKERYCCVCGRKLHRDSEDDRLREFAAESFSRWFEIKLHEFHEWDVLEENGWEVSGLVKGGFVRFDGFEALLANWGDDEKWWEGLEVILREVKLDKGKA